jgi:transcriptional regulator with XRE-family HTH domain
VPIPNKVPQFPAQLRAAREAAGMSGAEAARRLGMAPSNYWRLERRESPHWATVLALLETLGLPLEAFVPHALIAASAHRLRRAGGEHDGNGSRAGAGPGGDAP